MPNTPRTTGRSRKRREQESVGLISKDRIQIGVILFSLVGVLAGIGYAYYYGMEAKHYRELGERYHLNVDQLRRYKELEAAHNSAYSVLREHAEETRKRVGGLFERRHEATPEIQVLFEEANRQREACWSEEIQYHRKVSQIMNAEDRQRFLAEKEQRYRDRKADRNGFLMLPHN